MDAVMRKKVENDASAWMRSLAGRRGRNTQLAEKTITEAKSFTEGEALSGKLIDFIAKDEAELLRNLQGRELTRFTGERVTPQLRDARERRYEPTLLNGVPTPVIMTATVNFSLPPSSP